MNIEEIALNHNQIKFLRALLKSDGSLQFAKDLGGHVSTGIALARAGLATATPGISGGTLFGLTSDGRIWIEKFEKAYLERRSYR